MEPFGYRDERLHCEAVAASKLVAAYGTPLYVYSAGAIRGRLSELAGAFATLDPLLAYSVKSNGNLAVLRLVAAAGAGADIVSGGELYRARLAGIPGERIVFSGVGKTVSELAMALREGIYAFNVESAGELEALNELAIALGVRARMALRVNPDVLSPTPHHYTATGHSTTKFGIPFEEARALYRHAGGLPGIDVRGIDVHIGSQILDVAPFQRAVQRVVELVADLRADGHRLEFLDVGGGFGVSYTGEPGLVPRDFADALVPLVRPTGLRIVLEPGRYVSGPAGLLLARVLYVKRMAGKTYVITDAGMNDLLRPSHYASYHRILPEHHDPGRPEVVVDVVGPICESGDFLALDRRMPHPEPGELLAVDTAGAYGFSMASTYNARPRAAEVLVDGAQHHLVRRRETYADLVLPEVELA
ncbi:MAG: diaminopimelate decarboxylase [Gemmatimonadetes bacterium]|nr:diaminopimelate decarboxylase [Gemmatimonadota bacterium]